MYSYIVCICMYFVPQVCFGKKQVYLNLTELREKKEAFTRQPWLSAHLRLIIGGRAIKLGLQYSHVSKHVYFSFINIIRYIVYNVHTKAQGFTLSFLLEIAKNARLFYFFKPQFLCALCST